MVESGPTQIRQYGSGCSDEKWSEGCDKEAWAEKHRLFRCDSGRDEKMGTGGKNIKERMDVAREVGVVSCEVKEDGTEVI